MKRNHLPNWGPELNPRKIRLLLAMLFVLSSCKSFELTPEARDVVFTKTHIRIAPSLCRLKGEFWSDHRAKNEEEAINDLKNQAAKLRANFVMFERHGKAQQFTGDGKLQDAPGFGIYLATMYDCSDPHSALADHAAIEAKAAEEERKQEELRKDTKPHHWVLCGATGYSTMPPAVVHSMLEQFKPKAFDTENQCADKAWYFSKVGSQFGIQCSCKYVKLDR